MIRSARLCVVLGPAGESNLQGETQLDVYANQALLRCLGVRDNVVALVSEENGQAVMFDRSLEAGK
jgi:fructose-1,6-bisphosphatase I